MEKKVLCLKVVKVENIFNDLDLGGPDLITAWLELYNLDKPTTFSADILELFHQTLMFSLCEQAFSVIAYYRSDEE